MHTCIACQLSVQFLLEGKGKNKFNFKKINNTITAYSIMHKQSAIAHDAQSEFIYQSQITERLHSAFCLN